MTRTKQLIDLQFKLGPIILIANQLIAINCQLIANQLIVLQPCFHKSEVKESQSDYVGGDSLGGRGNEWANLEV